MTTPRKPVPRRAAAAIEEAAIRIQKAIQIIRPLQDEKRIIRQEEINQRALKVDVLLQEALRYLEGDAGAPTRPESGRSDL